MCHWTTGGTKRKEEPPRLLFRSIHEFFQVLDPSVKRYALPPFRSHLSFEIGANVLPGGERHHLTILISALRHTVIFGPIKNSPKLGAALTGLRLIITH